MTFQEAIKGQKIKRKKIYVDKEVLDLLQKKKKELPSHLAICEMAECCFDYFDRKGFRCPEMPINIFGEKKESGQLLVREDIYNELVMMKSLTGTSIQYMMSLIIKAKILSF